MVKHRMDWNMAHEFHRVGSVIVVIGSGDYHRFKSEKRRGELGIWKLQLLCSKWMGLRRRCCW